MAYLKGLDAIAITDHNSIQNVRAAMKVGESVGMTVIAGMEIESAEEVHILSLFPSIEKAEKAELVVRAHLPKINNNSDIFGRQLVIDENDNIIKEETQLLITATSLSIEDVFALVKDCGGVPITAHVDRNSYSVLSNLGFIPDDLGVTAIEISSIITDTAKYLEKQPQLQKYKIIRNSDSHVLGNISERINSIEVIHNKAEEILCKFI